MKNKNICLNAVPLTIQAAQGDGEKLPTFEMLAYTGAAVDVGWGEKMIIDLAGLTIPSQNLPIRLQHVALLGVGHTTEVKVDGANLVAKGIISRDTEAARDVANSGKNGYPWQASVGVSVNEYELLKKGQKTTANGQTIEGPVYVVRASELTEISFVDLGADKNTSARIAAQKHMEKSLMNENENVVENENLDTVRANRAPAVKTVKAENVSGKVIEAALYASANGTSAAEKHYDEKTLEAADKFRGLGLQEFIYMAARENGYTGRIADTRAMFEAAIPVKAQDWSTFSVTGVLGATANKMVLDGFYGVEESWREIAAVKSVPDLKEQTVYRMHFDTQYEQLAGAASGIAYGNGAEEEVAKVQAATYAKGLGITRQDIINDDMNVFGDASRALGRGAGLKINDVVWTLWLGNVGSGMFSTDNGNYDEGTDTALGIDSLEAAALLISKQQDSYNRPANIEPKVLLVPVELKGVATQITNSAELRDTTASKKFGVANPMFQRFKVVSSVYMSDSNYTGNSAKAWYLTADPRQVPALIVAFLRGRETPTVEFSQTDFNTLGIQYRGYLDFGACYGDYRAACKMKGEN